MPKSIVSSPNPVVDGSVRGFGRGSHFHKTSPKLTSPEPAPSVMGNAAAQSSSRGAPVAPPTHPRQARSRVLLRSIAKKPATQLTDQPAKSGSAVIGSMPVLLIIVGLGFIIFTR